MHQSSPVLLLSLAALLTCLPANGQRTLTEHTLARDTTAAVPQTDLGAFSFLVGSWRGTGFGGTVDEVWTDSLGGAMTGLFRLIQNGQLQFTEHMSIDLLDGYPVLRVKHFSADFTGWEEPDKSVDFPLVRVEPGTAYFNGLTLAMDGDDRLVVHLAMHGSDGTVREVEMAYERVRH